MMKLKVCSSSLAAAAALLASSCVFAGDLGVPVETPKEVNMVGLGVFRVPDYYGSSDDKGSAAPVIRYNIEGTKYYVQWIGAEISGNLVDRTDLRAGPLIRFRHKRDDDVDNGIVQQMRPIPTATEIGAFVAYHMPLDDNPQHKVVFYGDIAGNTTHVYNGVTENVRVTYFHPFEDKVMGYSLIGTVGFGLFFSNNSFNQRYFGVSGSDVALFPNLGGQPYKADGGLTSIKIPFSLSSQVDPKWLVTIAGRYERLLNDPKDSPVVSGVGNANQWIIGIAATYLF
jgi:outer membrane scaffolding protein for murein synthesis (MipA/OmpV family)